MEQIQFLTTEDVVAIHDRVMAASNQPPAALVRREALESAVMSCRHLAWHEDAGKAELAVQLAVHIALSHPWVGGNKGTAATSGIMFARYNGGRQPKGSEALEFGQRLIAVVEVPADQRPEIQASFTEFVRGWFPD